MTTRIIQNEHDRTMLKRFIDSHALPMTVTVAQGKHRSAEQNRLQRLWVKEISEQLGDRSAEEVRGYCKLHIGVPILRNENEAFKLKYDELIRPLDYEVKLQFMMVPLDFPVTRIMTTRQKTDYLNDISRHFGQQGIVLTDPEGLLQGVAA